MNELYLKIAFGLLWLVYVMIRSPHTKRYEKIEKKSVLGESRERIMMLFILIGMGPIPLLWVFSPWLNSFGMDLPIYFRIAGILLALFSLWYFWWVHKILGENWSPVLEIRKGHQLIKVGPYKRIRHPMYLQIWMWSIAQVLIISNWIAGLSGIVIWSIMYFDRIGKEEKMMLEEFGDDYRTYMKETGKIFPKF